jgi:hypothetical protein
MFWLAATVASTIYQGYAAKKAGDQQAALLNEQGLLSQTDFEKQAIIALDEGHRRQQQQAIDYISAGVEIQGTPLLLLAETAKKTVTQAEELRKTGKNSRAYYSKNARVALDEGRSALISSVIGGAAQWAKGT